MSMVLDGLSPRSRSTDPTTSVDAGRSVNLRDSQREALDLLAGVGVQMSDRELVEVALNVGTNYSPQRIRSARAELTELGLVERVEGVYTTSPTGRREQVWRVA